MTEAANGNDRPDAAAQEGTGLQVRMLGQYVKDLSFESPNIRKLMTSQADNPNLDLEINVLPEQVGPDVFEATLAFKARAESKSVGVIFDIELEYSGLFKIENAPPEVLDALLHVQCPTLLFPFLRRIIADTTRDGGIMPPLLLDPVDFGALYARKRQSMPVGTA